MGKTSHQQVLVVQDCFIKRRKIRKFLQLNTPLISEVPVSHLCFRPIHQATILRLIERQGQKNVKKFLTIQKFCY